MHPIQTVTIAARDDLFDELFLAAARTVAFQNAVEEAAYEQRDGALRKRMVETVRRGTR